MAECFINILCVLPMAVARSASDGVAIRYVLPALRMTSCFRTVGPMGRIKHGVMFRGVRQVAVRVGPLDVRRLLKCLVEFVRMRHRGRSLSYDCPVFYFITCQKVV